MGAVMLWWRWVVLALGAAATVLAVRWLLDWSGEYYLDLQVYRIGLEVWWQGGDIYGTLPAAPGGPVLDFIYPPFAAIVLAPLALVPLELAGHLLFATSALALAASLYVVARRLWRAGGRGGALMITAAALPGALVLEPMRETFGFGQVNLVLMALVAVDCLALRTRWPRGLLVGIAVAIKLTPLAFLLFFLLRRDRRAALVTLGTAVAAAALGFVVDAEASARYWFGTFAGASGLSGSPFRTNQAFLPALVRLEVPEPLATVCWIVLSLGALAVAVVAMRRAAAAPALMVNAGLMLIVSPVSWSHHWVWTAPTLLVLLGCAVRNRSIGWAGSTVLTAVIVYIGPHAALPGSGDRELDWTPAQQLVGNSYLLLAVGLLLAAAVRARRRPGPRAPVSLREPDAATAG